MHQNIKRMKNYARMAKEIHWPSISPKKRRELAEIKHILDNKNKPLKQSKDKTVFFIKKLSFLGLK